MEELLDRKPFTQRSAFSCKPGIRVFLSQPVLIVLRQDLFHQSGNRGQINGRLRFRRLLLVPAGQFQDNGGNLLHRMMPLDHKNQGRIVEQGESFKAGCQDLFISRQSRRFQRQQEFFNVGQQGFNSQ